MQPHKHVPHAEPWHFKRYLTLLRCYYIDPLPTAMLLIHTCTRSLHMSHPKNTSSTKPSVYAPKGAGTQRAFIIINIMRLSPARLSPAQPQGRTATSSQSAVTRARTCILWHRQRKHCNIIHRQSTAALVNPSRPPSCLKQHYSPWANSGSHAVSPFHRKQPWQSTKGLALGAGPTRVILCCPHPTPANLLPPLSTCFITYTLSSVRPTCPRTQSVHKHPRTPGWQRTSEPKQRSRRPPFFPMLRIDLFSPCCDFHGTRYGPRDGGEP